MSTKNNVVLVFQFPSSKVDSLFMSLQTNYDFAFGHDIDGR